MMKGIESPNTPTSYRTQMKTSNNITHISDITEDLLTGSRMTGGRGLPLKPEKKHSHMQSTHELLLSRGVTESIGSEPPVGRIFQNCRTCSSVNC